MPIKSKRNKKGFTIIEALIAMTLLAIVSMLMATAFVSCMRINLKNKNRNDSMDSQAGRAEQRQNFLGTPEEKTITFNIGGQDVTLDVEIGNADDSADLSFRYFKLKP